MSKCSIDHSLEDVQSKYNAQKEYIPESITALFPAFFEKERSQEALNEVFHLLKKYDLASDEDRAARDKMLTDLLSKA